MIGEKGHDVQPSSLLTIPSSSQAPLTTSLPSTGLLSPYHQQSEGTTSYRPEINGLRAIAVLWVVLYHAQLHIAGIDFFQGGFLGVDIFFVISGYLITSIIINDIEKEKFSFLVFYQRRIARIFPVFAVVLVATLGGASFIYSSLDFASAGAVGIAAMLSMANIKLLFQGDYFIVIPYNFHNT